MSEQDPTELLEREYFSHLLANDKDDTRRRLIIGTPTRGNVRIEWVIARYGQIIPCNWSFVMLMEYIQGFSPMGFQVADAQNLILKQAIDSGFEWLLLIEDDTAPPPDAFVRINEYMNHGKYPVVSGLYYTKSIPSEPLVYRGRGNSCFTDFEMGDLVWADGIPTGFFLCNMKVMRILWDESPEYMVRDIKTRRVFEQPEKIWYDPEANCYLSRVGTSDLTWCDRVMRDKVIQRAGWEEIGEQQYPFLVDTNLFCMHISQSGQVYPPGYAIPTVMSRTL